MNHLGKPNLFVIGAMKSGTTSLHNYLAEHPQIFMSKLKEPYYFVKEQNLNKGEDWYLDLFKDAPQNTLYIGESSTTYTHLPKYKGVAERIAQYNSDAKLIYIMRDPIKRTISHYWHLVRWHGEQRDMLTAIKEDPHYLNISNYYMQLEPYYELFPKNNIYILTFEEMTQEPEAALSKIFDWLLVDNNFIPSNIRKKIHVTPVNVDMIRGLGLLNKFRYSSLWCAVEDYCPKFLKNYGKRLATKEVDRSSVQIEDVITYLRPIQQEQVKLLSDYLKRDFNEWKTLYGAITESVV